MENRRRLPLYNIIANNPRNRTRYSVTQYKEKGFFFGKLYDNYQDSSSLDKMRQNIVDSNVIDDKLVTNSTFNHALGTAKDNSKVKNDNQRRQVRFNLLKEHEGRNILYPRIIKDTQEIGLKVMRICDDLLKLDGEMNVSKKDMLPSILATMSEKAQPQLVHCDMGYDYLYDDNMLLCIVALQNDTQVVVVPSSHCYNTLEDMVEEKRDGFLRQSVISMNKGEFCIFHPKLLHGGYTIIDEMNIRLHFYFNLTHIKATTNDDDGQQTQSDSLIFSKNSTVRSLYDTVSQKEHVKNIQKRKKEITEELLSRFENKRRGLVK